MKLFNRTLIILILILSCCSAKTEYSVPKADKVSKLFRIVEDKMEAHYKYIEKNRIFEDPIGRAIHFFKVIKTVAPQLLANTKLYKNEILNLLMDEKFKKYDFIDYDIPYLLYNLPIDDYVDLLNSVVILFKNGDINQDIFERFIFPDSFVSNDLYKNYRNKKLQFFLNNLLKDEDLTTRVKTQQPYQSVSFSENVLLLKNGTMWEGGRENSGLKKICKSNSHIRHYKERALVYLIKRDIYMVSL